MLIPATPVAARFFTGVQGGDQPLGQWRIPIAVEGREGIGDDLLIHEKIAQDCTILAQLLTVPIIDHRSGIDQRRGGVCEGNDTLLLLFRLDLGPDARHVVCGPIAMR